MHNENFENEHEMRSFVCAPCLLLRYNLEIFTEKKRRNWAWQSMQVCYICKCPIILNDTECHMSIVFTDVDHLFNVQKHHQFTWRYEPMVLSYTWLTFELCYR
jgi:hypothetical protein